MGLIFDPIQFFQRSESGMWGRPLTILILIQLAGVSMVLGRMVYLLPVADRSPETIGFALGLGFIGIVRGLFALALAFGLFLLLLWFEHVTTSPRAVAGVFFIALVPGQIATLLVRVGVTWT